MLGSDGEFGVDVGWRQIIFVKSDDLFAVFVVHRRISGSVENVDFITCHVGRRINGSGLCVFVCSGDESWNTGQERRAHAVQSSG